MGMAVSSRKSPMAHIKSAQPFPALELRAEKIMDMSYASWGPIFWPFLRRSAHAPTIKTIRGTVAIKGIFDN